MVNLLICFTIFCLISTFEYKTPPDVRTYEDYVKSSVISYQIDDINRERIGNKGGALFNGYFNEENYPFKPDINRKTYFTNKILDINNNKTYDINCGPWVVDESFYIFCEFDESIPKGIYHIKFDGINFNYSGVEINLYSYNSIKITKEDYDMVDLCSNIQTINLFDNKKEYELNYSVKLYHNEQLYFLFGNFVLANCNQKNDILTCTLKRDTIENNMGSYNLTDLLYFDRYGRLQFLDFSSFIQVAYNSEKKDIFVAITNLLTRNNIGINGALVYETNVTDIPNIDIDFFLSLYEDIDNEISCRFLKGEKKPMLFVCFSPFSEYVYLEKFSLRELKSEEIIQTAKYNFRIQPMKKNDIFIAGAYNESFIAKIYPEILDFTSRNSYQIEIFNGDSNLLTGITFNEKKEDLKCENNGHIKRCNVTKEHFEGLKTDYYYIMRDFFNNKEIAYEVVPIKVILPKESNNSKKLIIIFSILGSALVAIIIIIIIVICFYKNKNSDLKENVLKTSFQGEILE